MNLKEYTNVDFLTTGIVFLLLLAIGLFLILGKGKGAMMIAGYNTMRKEKREKYDAKALSRFVGWLAIAVAALMAPVTAGEYFGIRWLYVGGIALTFALAIAGVIYVNTGGRFEKKD